MMFVFQTPHLDGRHVVFGRVIDGMGVVQLLEKVSTSADDRPRQPVTIIDCGQIGEDEEEVDEGQTNQAYVSEKGQTVGQSSSYKDKKATGDEKGSDEDGEVEEDEEEAPPAPVDTSGMSEREKRMFQLRMKMNAARKANKKEVKEEYKR
jgi:cyclophilin family peptidyl-prolyl cis-trans isomerase